jgi:proteic killer suppression protein
MDISFHTSKLHKECNDYKKLVKAYGDLCANLIRRRLDDLADAETLDDLRRLPQVRCHELKGNRQGQLALDVKHPKRLIIKPNHEPIPLKPEGGLDWQAVTAVILLGVEDYHGDK